ncbi:MAG: acetyl-CoA acetyltransferase [Acidimicrobiales bacterium]
MSIDPRAPVVVGIGQVTDRPDSGGSADLTARDEPVSLMARAVAQARADLARSGQSLVRQTDALVVVDPRSWHYRDAAAALADLLGIDPERRLVTAPGGHEPQRQVNRAALAIARGELDVALVVAGERGETVAAARRHPDRPVLPWGVQDPSVPPALRTGPERRFTTEAEERHGLGDVAVASALYEHALRATAGRPLDEHRRRLARRWAMLGAVAAANPAAWDRRSPTAEEIGSAGTGNPMVADPYTQLLCPNEEVDQAAALVVCSVDAARKAGVPTERWVFVAAGADVDDHWYLSHRTTFTESPAARAAGSATLGAVGIGIDDVAHLDVHASSPAALEVVASALGVDADDPARPPTVTGGPTFAGSPGDGYGVHAVATLVRHLRQDPDAWGLVTSVGFALSAHSFGLYRSAPPPTGGSAPPTGTRVEERAGFRWADPQEAVAALPQRASDADASGEVTVETFSVPYGPDGLPARAAAACLTPDGRRSWASVTDPDQLALLVTEECCGRLGRLRDGVVDLR